ncbi:MAG: cupredoxin domain-containing protein [Thermoplasmatota archaeon]
MRRALLLALVVAGCASPAPTTSPAMGSMAMPSGGAMTASNVVNFTDAGFQHSQGGQTFPASEPGIFVNSGQTAHTLAVHDLGAGRILVNETVGPGAPWSFTFPHPGEFHVYDRDMVAMNSQLQIILNVT